MSEFLEDIGNPISDAAPCGEDITKLSPSPQNEEWIRKYAQLNELTRKVVTTPEDAMVRSQEVVELSQDILANKAKDLRIAGHLCRELLNQKGFTGFAEGLKGYHVLLEEYWDNGLYPLREAARLSNMQLLNERVAKQIGARSRDEDRKFVIPIVAGDGEALEQTKATAEEIRAVLKEKATLEKKIPNVDLSLQGLIKAVDERLRQPGVVVKKPEEEERKGWRRVVSPSKRKSEDTQTEVEPTAEAPSADGEFSSDLDAIKAVIRSAKFLLEKNFRNVAPYRLLRSVLWYLFVLPSADGKGRRETIVASPDKSKLEGLLRDEDWESLVIECEAVLVREIENGGSSFCLDVQRFLCTALKELVSKSEEGGNKAGKDAYEALYKAVLQETAMFVEHFASITEVFYTDKVPFADNQTKKWIEESVKPVFGTGSSAERSTVVEKTPPEGDSKISQDFEKAEALLARQKWEDALNLMQTSIDGEPSRKGRFQRRLNLAELCLDADRPIIARPLLEQLDQEIERFSLDQWEPSLCVQVWSRLRRCYQELSPQQESDGFYRERADRIFEKLCRLDIRAAIAPEAE